MTKYIALLLAFLMLGCGVKSTSPKIKSKTKPDVTQKSKTIIKRKRLPEGFREITKLRPIDANVPKTCQEWSDGCNTCTRAKDNQASCTIYTCENKSIFSCLKWQ